MTEAPHYSFGAFLRDRWLSCLLGVAACAALLLVLPIMGVTLHGCLFAAGLVALCFAGAGLWNYGRTRRYWRDLAQAADQSERVCELADLLDEPLFLEGRVAHGALETLAQSAAQESGALLLDKRAYREYVELWIHEVKTPLAAAKLVLASMHGAEAATLKAELERVESEVEQALYAARSETVAGDYAIREVDLLEAAREAVKRNAHLLIGRSVEVSLAVPEGMTVLADRPWLVFCLQQVVVNAAKYDAHSIVFEARIEEADTPRGRTVLTVRDDGCGIPAADMARVFERGFTGQVGRAHGSATGMGLYLVRTLCEQMGLGVTLASQEGVGTEVAFAFPHDRRNLATHARS